MTTVQYNLFRKGAMWKKWTQPFLKAKSRVNFHIGFLIVHTYVHKYKRVYFNAVHIYKRNKLTQI